MSIDDIAISKRLRPPLKHSRSPRRFGLGALMYVVAGIGILLGWWHIERSARYAAQEDVLEVIESVGGTWRGISTSRFWSVGSTQELLRLSVVFDHLPLNDRQLIKLSTLEGAQSIEELSLMNTNVTDHGLSHVTNMGALRYVNLSGCSISDRGLQCLISSPSLKTCWLTRTGITEYELERSKRKRPDIHFVTSHGGNR
jgi:hypothetical protein